MAKKTKDQLENELKIAQGQIQELLLEIGKLKQAIIEPYEKSPIHKADMKAIHDLKLQLEGMTYARNLFHEKNIKLRKQISELLPQISSSTDEDRNNLIRKLQTERDDLQHEVRVLKEKLKNSENAVIIDSLEASNASFQREIAQLKEDKEVLEITVKNLKHNLELSHENTLEIGKTLEESSNRYRKEIEKLEKQIWALKTENRKLWDETDYVRNVRGAGRKKNNEERVKKYITFGNLMKKGTSMKDIMGIMGISRTTYFRYLREYKEDKEFDERLHQINKAD